MSLCQSDVQMEDHWSIKPPFDVSRYRNNTMPRRDWCRAYDVIHDLIPFENKRFSPIQYLHDVREAIESAAPTKATFRSIELMDGVGHDIIPGRHPGLIRLAGLWEHCPESRHPDDMGRKRWVNPEYVHASSLRPITDPRERIEELRRAASIGLLALSDIAPRFGSDDLNTVYIFCRRYGITWREWRDWGLRRLARSLKIVYDWTEWSYTDLSRAIDVPRTTLRDWMKRHAADFDVPQDPSGEPWFMGSWGELGGH